MQQLRQRFVPEVKGREGSGQSSDAETDYFGTNPNREQKDKGSNFSYAHSSSTASSRTHDSSSSHFRRRSQVNAGDLHSMIGSSDAYRPLIRNQSLLFTPSSGTIHDHSGRHATDNTGDFDLREEVMDCFAKSIGLIQPPMSGTISPTEASPAFTASDPFARPSLNASFRSLSFLQTADDTSSVTGGSSIMTGSYNAAIDNEVEILFFQAGDTLIKAGEVDAGELYH